MVSNNAVTLKFEDLLVNDYVIKKNKKNVHSLMKNLKLI